MEKTYDKRRKRCKMLYYQGLANKRKDKHFIKQLNNAYADGKPLKVVTGDKTRILYVHLRFRYFVKGKKYHIQQCYLKDVLGSRALLMDELKYDKIDIVN